jgi:phospholipase D1/2
VMQTRDEETKKFFKHSSVICVLSPRYPSSKLGLVKQKASEIVSRAINVEIF